MPPLTALYFPRTAVSPLQISWELIFFNKIFYYLAAETDDSSSGAAGTEICEGYAPVPFEEEFNRFRQLIKELKGNEEEFYSGHLSSFSMGNEKNRGEQSVKSLIRSIEGNIPEEHKKPTGGGEELWQARLLLKLAEILYQEELELQRELSAISAKELELFEALKGEPEIPFTLTPFQQMENRLPVKPEILIKAWGKLFLADRLRNNYSILVSDQSDAVELLFDANETLTQKRPVCLFRIPLPAAGVEMELEKYLQARMKFRQEAKNTLEGFGTMLAECAAMGATPVIMEKFSALTAEWVEICKKVYAWRQQDQEPAGQADCQLAIYFCDESLARIMERICKKEIPPKSAVGGGPAFIALKSASGIFTCTD